MLGEGRYVLFNPELNVQMQAWDELFLICSFLERCVFYHIESPKIKYFYYLQNLLLLNQMHDTIFLRKVPMTGW